MRIDQFDLNLLTALDSLLTERHVSRAAARLHLTQSAMSRAFARLRAKFQDDLLVRTPAGYTLTPRAEKLQRDLADIMPRLAAMVRGGFDPKAATDTIRINLTDYPIGVLGPSLYSTLHSQAPLMNVKFESLTSHTFDDIERGEVDFALTALTPPPSLRRRTLFRDVLVGLVSADHPLTEKARLTGDDLAAYPHVRVFAVSAKEQMMGSFLAEVGVYPQRGLDVPGFAAAAAAVPGTNMITLLPRLLARKILQNADDVRAIPGPIELPAFDFRAVWHPRIIGRPALEWLRSQLVALTEEFAVEPK